jgi:tRNA threonylcarbamoyladenosine biosynthesis protein TsaE
MISIKTKSADDTKDFAAALSQAMLKGDLVVLVGQIGAGKTTFAQGFGHGLGVSEPITSPTFVLMRSYEAPLALHHVDIYRLDHLQEVIEIGLLELLDEGGVALMEWGDLAAPVLPHDYLEITIELDDVPDARAITLAGVGSAWSSREEALKRFVGNWIVDRADSEENQ